MSKSVIRTNDLHTLVFNDLSQIDDGVKGQWSDVRFAPTLGTLQQVLLEFDPPEKFAITINSTMIDQKMTLEMFYLKLLKQ